MEPDKPGSWCLKRLKISTSQSYCRTLQSTDTLLDASESVLHRWLLESCSDSFTIYIYLKLAFLLRITEYKYDFNGVNFQNALWLKKSSGLELENAVEREEEELSADDFVDPENVLIYQPKLNVCGAINGNLPNHLRIWCVWRWDSDYAMHHQWQNPIHIVESFFLLFAF